jgi:hypothetical protein
VTPVIQVSHAGCRRLQSDIHRDEAGSNVTE